MSQRHIKVHSPEVGPLRHPFLDLELGMSSMAHIRRVCQSDAVVWVVTSHDELDFVD